MELIDCGAVPEGAAFCCSVRFAAASKCDAMPKLLFAPNVISAIDSRGAFRYGKQWHAGR